MRIIITAAFFCSTAFASAQNGGFPGSGYEIPNRSSGANLELTNVTYRNTENTKLLELVSKPPFNWDGFNIDLLENSKQKNWGFLNFSNGTYRGTIFNNIEFDYAIGIHPSLSIQNIDYTHTKFSKSKIYMSEFRNWYFREIYFENSNFSKSVLNGCVLENSEFIKSVLFGLTFNQSGVERHFNNYFNLSDLSYLNFNKAVLENWIFAGGKFTSNNISSTRIKGFYGRDFGSSGGFVFGSNKFERDSIENLTIENSFDGGNANSFTNCTLYNSSVYNSEISFRFQAAKWHTGFFNKVAFGVSEFNNCVFGPRVSGFQFNIKEVDFSQSSFITGVFFRNCTFEECKWPADLSKVTFVNCVGAPKALEDISFED